jgi:glycosyltransferase involved in cell wall biosynthesis
MRVAILGSRGYPSTYSGYETLVRHLAPGLRDRGFDVTVYCRATDVPRPARGISDEIDGIARIWTAGLNGKSTSTLSHGFTSIRDAARRGFDAALVLNVANGYFLPTLRRAGIPTAVNVDGIEWERDKWNALGKAVFRRGASLVARNADEIIVDSRAIGDYWQRVFARTGTFIPYGADVHTDVPSDRLAEIGVERGTYVLVIARIVPENNVGPFLDAVELLDHATPVVVVGSAVGRSALETRLAHLASTRRAFHWLGHVSDQELLRQLRAHCGVYWHGHSVGGTNPSLLEAMGCGAPIIAVDTVYNREVLDNEEQICQATSAQLAHTFQQVLSTENTRDSTALHEQRVVARRYRWTDVCCQYATILRRLANSRLNS